LRPATPNAAAAAGWADHPWWYVDTWSRVKHAVTLTAELLAWVKAAHPYWNRTGGSDHIWHFAHDEGACWAPEEVYAKSVIITHWGRVDADHVSGTTYYPVGGWGGGGGPMVGGWDAQGWFGARAGRQQGGCGFR
jgi:hypothetical protein